MNYIIEKRLGLGNFGMTFKGIEVNETTGKREVVAIKILFPTEKAIRDYQIENEIRLYISSRMNYCHPNFLCFKDSGMIEMEDRKNYDYLYNLLVTNLGEVETGQMIMNRIQYGFPIGIIITQFIEGVDLEEILDRTPPGGRFFDDNQIELFAVQMLEAVRMLYSLGLYHRDIKPGNIMVESIPKLNFVLVDFGLACYFVNEKFNSCFGRAGSRAFMTNEVITYKEKSYKNSQDYVRIIHQSDLFAIAVVIYELYEGKNKSPYPENKEGLKDMSRFTPIRSNAPAARVANYILQNYNSIDINDIFRNLF